MSSSLARNDSSLPVLNFEVMKGSISSLRWISTLLVLLWGCAHKPAASRLWRESSGLKSDDTAATLKAIANDESLPARYRALAVFRLFANHLHPGESSAEVHDALANSSWLQNAKIFGTGTGSGWAPVEWTLGDSPFVIVLFPDKHGQSDWLIWLVISGHPPNVPYREKELLKFFEGDLALQAEPKLKEFALCFTGGIYGYTTRSERFSLQGIYVYPY